MDLTDATIVPLESRVHSIPSMVKDEAMVQSNSNSHATFSSLFQPNSFHSHTHSLSYSSSTPMNQTASGKNGHRNWDQLPPELLRGIIERVASGDTQWPSRRSIVACAGVCRQWRILAKELTLGSPYGSTLHMTYPFHLMQPGPQDKAVECFIRRNKRKGIYTLHLGSLPSPNDYGKFLIAARKCSWRLSCTEYHISLDPKCFSRNSSAHLGVLRANFLSTKFSVVDSSPSFLYSNASSATRSESSPDSLANHNSRSARFIPSPNSTCLPSSSPSSNHCSSSSYDKSLHPDFPTLGRSSSLPHSSSSHLSVQSTPPVASVWYALNVLGARGPRRIQCVLNNLPVSSRNADDSQNDGEDITCSANGASIYKNHVSPRSRRAVADCSVCSLDGGVCMCKMCDRDNISSSLVLKNKPPRWHEQLQCWCLNFRGRVTVASVKNFQLIEAQGSNDLEKAVLLQFGKIGKDIFTMDYRYPLSAFQAFAICLSSFDTKVACE